MTTIYDSTLTVKPARFALGIAPARRRRFVPSEADRQWWACNAPSNATGYTVEPEPTGAELDRLADESAWLDRYTAGATH